jgi:hypothetical protein
MDDKMTFTVTAYGKSVTIIQPEDLDIHEFLDTCRDLAIVMEYHEDSWKDAIIAAADSLSDHFVQDYVNKYSPENNPLMAKKNLWKHADGEFRDYPDIDNITLPSDC